jgi:hypothetical protein
MLDLPSLLILPVQHYPRYTLHLSALAKCACCDNVVCCNDEVQRVATQRRRGTALRRALRLSGSELRVRAHASCRLGKRARCSVHVARVVPVVASMLHASRRVASRVRSLKPRSQPVRPHMARCTRYCRP